MCLLAYVRGDFVVSHTFAYPKLVYNCSDTLMITVHAPTFVKHSPEDLSCLFPFRWVMIRKDAGNSPSQLCFSLFEGSSKQSLASFHGPGFQQKQFWVQQSQHDVLSVQQTDDRAWLQVVVATCMVAAKTQRHKDKVTNRSRR